MIREQYLTQRWNNLLTLGLGLPILVYVVVALSTSVWTSTVGFIAFQIMGAVY